MPYQKEWEEHYTVVNCHTPLEKTMGALRYLQIQIHMLLLNMNSMKICSVNVWIVDIVRKKW